MRTWVYRGIQKSCVAKHLYRIYAPIAPAPRAPGQLYQLSLESTDRSSKDDRWNFSNVCFEQHYRVDVSLLSPYYERYDQCKLSLQSQEVLSHFGILTKKERLSIYSVGYIRTPTSGQEARFCLDTTNISGSERYITSAEAIVKWCKDRKEKTNAKRPLRLTFDWKQSGFKIVLDLDCNGILDIISRHGPICTDSEIPGAKLLQVVSDGSEPAASVPASPAANQKSSTLFETARSQNSISAEVKELASAMTTVNSQEPPLAPAIEKSQSATYLSLTNRLKKRQDELQIASLNFNDYSKMLKEVISHGDLPQTMKKLVVENQKAEAALEAAKNEVALIEQEIEKNKMWADNFKKKWSHRPEITSSVVSEMEEAGLFEL